VERVYYRTFANDVVQVERIIQEDYALEAFEQVELYCELVLARFGLLDAAQ
jgi:hypothetical protein